MASRQYSLRSRRALASAAGKEDPSRLREARARTSDSDFGGDDPRLSPLMNVGPSGRQRTVGKLVAKGFDLEGSARPARVADGCPLVGHVTVRASTSHHPAESPASELSGSRPGHQPSEVLSSFEVAQLPV